MSNILSSTQDQFLADFDLLSASGNIGFFESCQVTQISIYRNGSKAPTNLFTLIKFLDLPVDNKKLHKLGMFKINNDNSIAAVQFNQTITEARGSLHKLIKFSIFEACGHDNLEINIDRFLPKKFYPGDFDYRMKKALGIDSRGAYVLEGVDQKRLYLESVKDILNDRKIFDKHLEKIQQVTDIDLRLITDKLGGIVCQFPIGILNLAVNFNGTASCYKLSFNWDKKLSQIPKCFIHSQSKIYEIYSATKMCEYNGEIQQDICLDTFELNSTLLIYREEPGLLLGSKHLRMTRPINMEVGVANETDYRIFSSSEGEQKIQIFSNKSYASKGHHYLEYIHSYLDTNQIQKLSEELKLKQYFSGQRKIALDDVRKLINRYNYGFIYLWDPFLRSSDILDTLYYCAFGHTELRAIGATSDSQKLVLEEKELTISDLIAKERAKLESKQNNNFGLKLEFRLQYENHGSPFHDRFLMFPGKFNVPSKAFSLGTSINSIGKSHHILQEVMYPQIIIDAFNELWKKLDKSECLVFKN